MKILFLQIILLLWSSSLFAWEVKSDSASLEKTLQIETFYALTKPLASEQTPPIGSFKVLQSNYFGITNSNVWLRIKLTNTTDKNSNIVLMSPFPTIDYIDVAIFDKSGKKRSYKLGDKNHRSDRPILSRFNAIPISLHPNESISLLMHHFHPTGTMITQWEIFEAKAFEQFILKDTLFWGVFTGVMLILVLQSVMFYFAFKKRFYLYYAAVAFFSLIFQLNINGVLYMYDIAFSFAPAVTLGLAMLILIIRFGIEFFEEISKTNPKTVLLLNVYSLVVALLIIFNVLAFPSSTTIANWSKYASFLGLLLPFYVALVAYAKKWDAAIYFLLSHTALFLGYLYILLVRMGYSNRVIESNYAAALIIFFEIILLAIAIAKKYRTIETQRQEEQKNLEVQSQFAMLGQAASHILHQWRQPVSHIGTLAMYIHTTIKNGGEELSAKLSTVIPKLNDTIEFMNQTMTELNSLYHSNQTHMEFNAKNEVSSVLEILEEKIRLSGCDVALRIPEDLNLFQSKNAFSNIVLSIVDNALNVLSKRQNYHGKIEITASTREDSVIFAFKDNAGGVAISPPERIFDAFVSNGEGSCGLGLSIVKMLVETKLNGSIDVASDATGACFRVAFPLRHS